MNLRQSWVADSRTLRTSTLSAGRPGFRATASFSGIGTSAESWVSGSEARTRIITGSASGMEQSEPIRAICAGVRAAVALFGGSWAAALHANNRGQRIAWRNFWPESTSQVYSSSPEAHRMCPDNQHVAGVHVSFGRRRAETYTWTCTRQPGEWADLQGGRPLSREATSSRPVITASRK